MFINEMAWVPGIKIGHYTDLEAATGCTVLLCEDGAVAGMDIGGSAPGTREAGLLQPTSVIPEVQALLLSGGSAFGLAAAAGVERYLEEKGLGYQIGGLRVPIVPAAILFDLRLGSPRVRPGPEEGYRACLAASEEPPQEGSVGAGTGATVGKALEREQATKGGLGLARRTLGEVVVGAVAAVNAWGDVVDPRTGEVLAGPRNLEEGGFFNTLELIREGRVPKRQDPSNTTLAVVATNARLDRLQALKLAQMAQDGLALAVRPVHTLVDGDVVFSLATGKSRGRVDITALGALAAEALAEAIVRAITQAKGLAGIPSAREWLAGPSPATQLAQAWENKGP